MTAQIQLTDTQRHILEQAADHPEGLVTNQAFPDNIKGAARTKVITSLFSKALVTGVGIFDCFITDAGYDAVGRTRKSPAPVTPDAETDAAVAATEATWAEVEQDAPAHAEAPKPKLRDGTKQAQVIAMLSRPSGATIADICEATGWQCHTVRGTLAGAFKKKLGLTITSTKESGAPRVYRVG